MCLVLGKCDSYVKIKLSPENEFIGLKSHKTNVSKDTQFPLYDESFSMFVYKLLLLS